MTPRDPNQLFEDAVAALRDEPIDPLARQAALERAQRRLLAEAAPPAGAADGAEPSDLIAGCAGFRALLPAYRAGALSESRRLLLEDHLRECVPCRRAWHELKRGRTDPVPESLTARRPTAWRLAASLGGAALLTAGLWLASGLLGPQVKARVVSIDGSLFTLDGQSARPVAAGESFGSGGVLRTAAGSRAVLELGDGTRVELDERVELGLDRRRDGVVLALDRGNVIVEAAKQRRGGHLYVRTDDCLVSVAGTIFSVNRGARGSRVSVLDGEVRVRQGAELAVLRPGEQLATSARLERVPLERDIAWSRNAPAYRQRLAALRALGRELEAILATGEGRTSTRLLDLAPASTIIWAAAPNLSQSLAEAWSRLEERAAENPTLSQWWQERVTPETAAEIRAALDNLRDLGSRLGDEIAVALPGGGTGEPGEPLLYAEVRSPLGLAEAIDQEIARLASQSGAPLQLRRIEDPSTSAEVENGLLLWLAPGDLLAASPSLERLRELQAAIAQGGSGFATTPFHARLAAAYAEGVEWLVAADLGTAIAKHESTDAPGGRALTLLGLDDVQHVVVQSRGAGEQGAHRAELAFAGERHGVAAWLAEPAPSGALEFVSADAQVAIAGLTKAPLEMFDDLLRLSQITGEEHPDLEQGFQDELGLSLRDDLAAALGGDFALAVDGPWLPQPAWKAVVEVLDANRLQSALARLVEAANRHAAAQGKPGLVLGEEDADGQVYHRVALDTGRELGWYVFADGYLVAAPSRALLAQSLARRAAGATLLASPAFLERLPRDGEPNFSALVWQNLGASLGDLAQLVGQEGAAALQATQPAGPTLLLAYGGADRITFLAQGAAGPLGMSLQNLLAASEAISQIRPTMRPARPTASGGETPTRPSA